MVESNMALKITADCINCGACEFECPTGAIYYGEDHYEIDPNKCTECEEFFHDSKCTLVCPVDCIIPGDNPANANNTIAAKLV